MKKPRPTGRCNSIGTQFRAAIGCKGIGPFRHTQNTPVSATRTAHTAIYACAACQAFTVQKRAIWESTPDGPQAWAKRAAVQKFLHETLARNVQ